MKMLSLVLAAYISFLSVHPIKVAVDSENIQPSEEANMPTCCEEDPICMAMTDCFPDEGCTPGASCVCGLYCFCGEVQSPHHPIAALESMAKAPFAADRTLIPNYHSDCFRPPEII